MQTSAAEVTTDELALLPDAIQPERDFSAPENFINRELSWLEFNRRVLEEAQDPTQPLIERVKFLTIFSSNLDEFFEIRVAGIKQQIESETSDVGPDGMTPTETFNAIQRLVHELVATEYALWNNELMPALAKNGIRVHDVAQLTAKRAAWARRYFQEEVFPMLTPLAVDASHPFPQLVEQEPQLAGARTGPSGRRTAPRHCPGAAGGTAADFNAARQRRRRAVGLHLPRLSHQTLHRRSFSRPHPRWRARLSRYPQQRSLHRRRRSGKLVAHD